VALAVSVLTLFSMLKIWLSVFWKSKTKGYEPSLRRTGWKGMTAASFALVIVSLFMGLFAEFVLRPCYLAAGQIMDAEAYRQEVLAAWDRRGL